MVEESSDMEILCRVFPSQVNFRRSLLSFPRSARAKLVSRHLCLPRQLDQGSCIHCRVQAPTCRSTSRFWVSQTAELPPHRRYIFGYHPHGIIGMGASQSEYFCAVPWICLD